MILAECAIRDELLTQALNGGPEKDFHLAPVPIGRSRIFIRFPRQFFQTVFESDRTTIARISLPARDEILLCAVHFPSKLHWSNESQALEASVLSSDIIREEDTIGHQRTLVVGDLNMDPFEHGVVGAAGLHAVTSREIATRGTRMVQGRDYRFFYNPMWSHFGDSRRKTAGSFYYQASEHVSYFWHIFDQVLLRPELARDFDPDTLKIVTSCGVKSLVLADGRPDGGKFSDHLPIVFELNF